MTRTQVLNCVGLAELEAGTRVRVTWCGGGRRGRVTLTGAVGALRERTLDLVETEDGKGCRVRVDGRTLCEVPSAVVCLHQVELVEVFS